MRSLAIMTITLSALVSAPVQAAKFECTMELKTCTIDTTEGTPCSVKITPTAVATCKGGSSSLSVLVCYVAPPETSTPVLGNDPESVVKAVQAVPGLMTATVQFTETTAAPMSLLYIPRPATSSALVVICSPRPQR